MSSGLAAVEAVFTFQSLSMIALGVVAGLIVGAIPGFSASMGIAVLLPFTFALDPVPGLMLLLGLYASALYAGAIPAILVKTPGTAGAAATMIDGHPMAQSGKAGQALRISLIASVVGGLIGVVLVTALVPVLASFALSFGPSEYFMLAIFALAIIASLSQGAVLKGLISGLLGLALAFVGLDPIQFNSRYTFGVEELSAGIEFVPVLIGLFGVAEALVQYERFTAGRATPVPIGDFRLPKAQWRRLAPTTWWSSLLGFFIGVAPGAGGTVGSFIAYNETKRFARGDKSSFGKGDPRGVASPESANNASIAGALAPMLTLGIPGDAGTAVLIGALTIHGLQPGPDLFSGSPELVYGTFLGLAVVYFVILLVGLVTTRMWSQILRVPPQYLWPIILVLTIVGSYALRHNVFDVLVMTAMGVLGYLMLKGGYPVTPIVVGLILGPIAESGLRRALIINEGSYSWLLDPIPLALLVLTVASLLRALLLRRLSRSRES